MSVVRFHFSLLVFLAALFIGAQAFAYSIDAVRVGAHPGKTRMVLELSDAVAFRVFLLADPYRIVIDMPDFDWHATNIMQPSNSPVHNLRRGPLSNGISRIVFDLAKPVSIQSAFLLPASNGESNRLVIDFIPSNEKRFRSELNTSFGTLGTNSGNNPVNAPVTPVAGNYLRVPDQAETNPMPGIPPVKPLGKKPLIIIDPGHGGPDFGALGINGVAEKNVTLALGKELKRQLEETGQYRVLLTRDSDFFIALRERVKFARDRGGDLFVSIHADSIDKPGVQGASIYTLSEKASDEQSAKLAARENKADLIAGIDLSTEDEEVANILVDLTMRDTMNQSRFFASRLANFFTAQGLRLLEKPTRSAGFAVLKAPDIPSVLVEAGYMSNKNEVAKLSSDSHRKKIASALTKGIDAYFEQVRKNQRI